MHRFGPGYGLDEAATGSVQEWALSPATRNGGPVEVVARLAGYKGTIVLQAVLKKGRAVDIIRVVRGLPFGLGDSVIQELK